MTAKEKAAILKRIFAPPEKAKPKFVNTNIKYSTEIFTIVSIVNLFWCVEGEIFEVVKDVNNSHFKTVNPVIRKCEYGLILIKNCQLIN